MKIFFNVILILFFVPVISLHAGMRNDSIILHYDGESLEDVLADLESKYQIKFSYSNDKIPVTQKIYASVESEDIFPALEKIFEQTQIVFEFIGGQVVLAIDKNKEVIAPDMGHNIEEEPLTELLIEPIVREVRLEVNPAPFVRAGGMNLKPTKDPSYVTGTTGKSLSLDLTDVRPDRQALKTGPNLHASVLYPFGIRTNDDETVPTQFGLHLSVGVDHFLDGVQVSGLGGTVLNDMEGAQISGLFNGVLGTSEGAQIAGILNFSKDEMSGLQAAGIANTSLRGDRLVQLGGITNIAMGDSEFQLAGVVNVGNHVKKGQMAGIINIAKKVDGFQLGLINIADSISGPAIGLLSFARNGYHSFELSGQESLHANAILRLGTRQFYNVFRMGSRVDELTWALGYGIGTSIKVGRKHFLQMEIISSHVNENSGWTNKLNLLNQLNVNANFKLGKHFSVALGPTLNIAVSQVYNEETDLYGMGLGQNYFLDETRFRTNRNPTNVKGWIGFHAGIRFESK